MPASWGINFQLPELL